MVNGVTQIGATPEIADSKNQAEYVRLLEEMRKRSRKNIWRGVEDAYGQILALRGVKIGAEVYDLSAQAARALGDILSQYERVKLMKIELMFASEPDDTQINVAVQTITDIEKNYGRVEIILSRKGSYTLTCSLPFAPDQRGAIAFAQNQLAETKSFHGLLPAIEYTLIPAGGQSGQGGEESFTPPSILSQGTNEDYLQIAPHGEQRDVAEKERETHTSRKINLWASVQGGYNRLLQPNGNQTEGMSYSASATPIYKPFGRIPFQLRAGIDVGWQSLGFDNERENLRSVPIREGVGLDFVPSLGAFWMSIGPTIGFEQHIGTSGQLFIGTEGVTMTEPALKPVSLFYGPSLMIGWKEIPLSIVGGYRLGSTEIRGVLPEYNNAVGTTNIVDSEQFVIGFAAKLR